MLTLAILLSRLFRLYGSAAAIGRALNIDRRHLDLITKRGRMPDSVIVRAAMLSGLDPAYALCCLHAEHATDSAEKRAWYSAAVSSYKDARPITTTNDNTTDDDNKTPAKAGEICHPNNTNYAHI